MITFLRKGSEKNRQLEHSLSLSTGTDISDEIRANARHHGQATVRQSALNVAKTCMGTGTLALPYAASQGGYIFSSIGLIAMALWNLYCVDRMMKCADLLHVIETRRRRSSSSVPRLVDRESRDDIDEAKTPPGTSTYGKVVWTAIGPTGLKCVDGVMIVLLLGIIVAYEGKCKRGFVA